MPAPAYRQELFAREATSWTQPLQAAAAAYLTVTGIANLLLLVLSIAALRSSLTEIYRQSGEIPAELVPSTVTSAIVFVVVFSTVLAIFQLALAAVSYLRRWTWVFIVDMVYVGLGALLEVVGLLVRTSNQVQNASPPGQRAVGTVEGIVALALLGWMVVATLRYGPWAMHRAPAPLP
jgi:hypothetical protein